MVTPQSVRSRFSVASPEHGAERLGRLLPWKIVSSDQPHGPVDYFVTVFDLRLGSDRRVDRHLERATNALFEQRVALRRLGAECRYALWVRLRSSAREIAADVPDEIASSLAGLRVGLHLRILAARGRR